MRKRRLSEVLGLEKSSKRLTGSDLRSLVLKEIRNLTEQEAKEDSANGVSGGFVDISAGPAEVLAAATQLISDPKTKAMMTAGKTDDEGPPDEVIAIQGGSRKAGDLVPTQNVIGSEQSLIDQVGDNFGNLDNAIQGGRLSSAQGQFPILTFGNNILDGHHRWSQAYATNPNAMLDTAEITAPGITNPEQALGLVHYILFSLYGNSPTKAFKGENLFTMTSDQVYDLALANMSDTAPAKLVAAGLIEDATPEAAAEYYAEIGTDGSRALPSGAFTKFDRTVMPQPLDAGDPTGLSEVPPEAAAGEINYDDPALDDVKESRTKRLSAADKLVLERWSRMAGLLK